MNVGQHYAELVTAQRARERKMYARVTLAAVCWGLTALAVLTLLTGCGSPAPAPSVSACASANAADPMADIETLPECEGLTEDELLQVEARYLGGLIGSQP